MEILIINAGSTSLKGARYDVDGRALQELSRSSVLPVAGAEENLRALLGGLGAKQPSAIGHRVVHGGGDSRPRFIDEATLGQIQRADRFAPLHNRPAVEMIEACRTLFPHTPMAAAFDSAFHSTMPEHAWMYAIAQQLADRYGIRRYGFHGFAHRSMLAAYARMSGVAEDRANIVTVQLGGGCSATAIREGISIDTSMGFTPLEGIPMATRSGDIDAGIVLELQRSRGMNLEDVEHMLYESSGLLGVGGTSDTRQLLRAEAAGDLRAGLALDLFCYRTAKYIGAYHLAVGGAQAVVFGGGVGEHSPEIRARICRWLAPLGLTIHERRNKPLKTEGEVSADGSTMRAFVAHVDEEFWIARDILGVIGA